MIPKAYYNEFDPFAAEWLRHLKRGGHIMRGRVDSRSIVEVKGEEIKDYEQVHLFAGIGGWQLALKMAGWPVGRSVWTGSCPCQPFSTAGTKRGTEDKRHLWPEMFRLVKKSKPDTIFGEQVANGIGQGWVDRVSTDLEEEGYAFGSVVLGAHSVGAPHIRNRIFWVASKTFGLVNPDRTYGKKRIQHVAMGSQLMGASNSGTRLWDRYETIQGIDKKIGKVVRRIEPGTRPLGHGVSPRLGRLRGYGNAIIPQAAEAFILAFLGSEK